MAMTNFTADTNQGSTETLYYSKEFAGDSNNVLIVLIALNVFVSVIASVGNALILAALHKESLLHPPSKLLFRNLATTDLAVGIIAVPFHISYLMSLLNQQWNIFRFTFVGYYFTVYILCGVSLSTLTAISVDRLLALLSGLRYRQVVTLKRIRIICIGSWFVFILNATMLFLSRNITLLGGCIIILLCLVSSAFSYAKIFFTLRHHQVQAQGQQNQNVLPNRARYKKTVYSALWVQVALVLCYLPTAIKSIVLFQRGLSPSLFTAHLFTETLVLLNSSLNPILYCWKIIEVRQAVKEIVKGLFCSSS